jgi:predicted N-acetyltransferase YhbS
LEIVAFDRRAYDRTLFDCGNDEMNEWIRTRVSGQEKSDNVRTFVAVTDNRVVGYYATCAYQLSIDDAALAFGIGKKKYPLPAILFARLAVDVSVQGTGVAKALLVHALENIALVSTLTGVEVVVVDAINLDVVAFYAKHGFIQFEDHNLKLFMPTKDLRATFAHAD